MSALIEYLKATRTELNHVSWPTRTQTIIFTALVIALSLIVSLMLGAFDFVFSSFISNII